MKIWLNNLKEGDIFYHIVLKKVWKCLHLGDAHNMSYKMRSIKFRFLDEWPKELDDVFRGEHEAFVNQYVYDTKEEAQEVLTEKLKKELLDIQTKIITTKVKLRELEENELEIKKLLEDDQQTIKKISENPNLVAFCNKILSYNMIFEEESVRNMFLVSLISADTLVDENSCDETIETANFILNNINLMILDDDIKKYIINHLNKALEIAQRDKEQFIANKA